MDIKDYISSGVIEAYVLGNTSPEESSILECVMKNNQEVRQAVFEAQIMLEQLATAQAITPPAYVKAEILKKIDFSKTEESSIESYSLPTAEKLNPKQFYTPGWMKAAAVAAVFGLGYLGYEVSNKSDELKNVSDKNMALSTEASRLNELNSVLKTSRKIQLKGVEKHPDMLAQVYVDAANKVYLDINNLPTAPAGKQYQLWAIVEGKPVDLGVYEDKNDFAMQAMKSVNNAQAFAITLEKTGGSVTPTMEEMYVMGES